MKKLFLLLTFLLTLLPTIALAQYYSGKVGSTIYLPEPTPPAGWIATKWTYHTTSEHLSVYQGSNAVTIDSYFTGHEVVTCYYKCYYDGKDYPVKDGIQSYYISCTGDPGSGGGGGSGGGTSDDTTGEWICVTATTIEGVDIQLVRHKIASEWYVRSINSSSNVPSISKSTTGTVTIPSSYGGYEVYGVSRSAFYDCRLVNKVVIPNTVKYLSNTAFWYCGISEVEFGNSVLTIDPYTFRYCPNLKEVVLPSSVKYIRNCAFDECDALETITIPANLEELGYSAFSCKNIKTVINLSPTPLALTNNPFYSTIYNNATLYVPKGSKTRYENADYWKNFKTIVEGTPTDQNVLVNKITINPTSGTLKVNETMQLSATVSPTDATDKSVIWSSNNTSVASVSTTGLVTAKNSGTAVITCEAKDGSGISANCTVNVVKTEATAISIPSSKTIKVDEEYTLTYTLTPTNAEAAVKWSSLDKNIATVSSTGVVRGIGVGVAKITATTDNGKTSICTVTVEAKPIDPTKIWVYSTSVEVGYTTKMKYTLQPEGATTTIKWTSSDTSIATVSSDGTITGKKAGTAKITATTANGLSDWANVYVGGFKDGTTFNYVTTEGNIIVCKVKDISKKTCEIASNSQRNEIKGKVTIPSSIQGYTPISVVSSAFSNCQNLESISLPNTIEEIGSYAFSYCGSLRSISLPSKLTKIDRSTFYYCKSLKSISLPTSLEGIESYAFYSCESLESISLPSKVKTIEYSAFSYCKSLKSFTGYNSLEYIGSLAFNQNPWIENLSEGINYIGKVLYNYKGTMPENTTLNIKEGCTQICDGALRGKSGLVCVYIPESVTSITDNPFNGCGNLNTIKVAATNKVYDSRNNCNAIMETKTNLLKTGCASTVIPNNTKAIGYDAFYGIGSIKEISIPNSVDSLANYALYSHEKINIGKGLRVFGNCSFYNLKNTKSISVDAGNQYFDSRQNCNAIIEKATNTLRVGCSTTVIPETVKAIGDYAFNYCLNDSILNVTIPNNIEKVGDYAYLNNSAIQLITIGKKVKELGTYIIPSSRLKAIHSLIDFPTDINENAFKSYNGVDSLYNHAILYVPKGSRGNYMSATGWKKFKNIVEVDDDAMVEGTMFKHKTKEGIELTYMVTNYKNKECEWIRIPEGVTGTITVPSVANGYAVKSVGDRMVYKYSGKVNIVLPDVIERIGDFSFYYSDVTRVNIPNSLKSVGQWSFFKTQIDEVKIPKSCESIGHAAFAGNINLKKITVDSANKIYDSRNNSNVIYEKSTNTLVLGCANSTVPDETETIGFEAFYFAENLKNIKLNSSLKKIDNFAFYNSGITSIEIPAAVKTIVNDAFRQCKNLKDVTVYAKTPIAISDSVFYLANDSVATFDNATLYVPAGTKDAYMAANGWKKFKNIVEMNTLVENIKLNATEVSIALNETMQLTATVEPTDATDKSVIWSSNNTTVASVSTTGLVTAKAVGSAIITCKANDGSGVSASCSVKVEAKSGITNVYVESISCDNSNLCKLTNNDVIKAHVRISNKGESGIIQASVKLFEDNDNSTKHGLKSSSVIKKYVEAGQSEIFDFELSLTDVPKNSYYLAVYYYDDEDQSNYYNSATMKTIALVDDSELKGDGSAQHPFNSKAANAMAASLSADKQSTQKYYIEGKVSSIKYQFTDGRFTSSFYLSDDGTNSYRFYIYSTLYYDDKTYPGNGILPQVGDHVILYGNLVYYKGNTPEMADGKGVLISINGITGHVIELSSAGYGTFYDSKNNYELPEDLSASVVTSCYNDKLTFRTIADGKTAENVIPKGTAVMIENRVKSGGKYTLTSTTNSATYTGSNYLYGRDNTTTTSAAGDNYYYKLTYGNGGNSNVFGWYWGSRDGSAFTIEGHKAWLAIPKSNVGSRAFSAEGEAMDIHEVSGDESDATYYDLQGRAVGSPVRNGLYIKNGKKVVVNKMK